MPAFVSPDNVQLTPLQSQTFAQGASVSVQTAGALPTGRRVRAVYFILDIDETQPTSPAAQLGAAQYQLISQIKIARRVSITGYGLSIMNWLMRGYQPSFPAGYAAGTAADVRSRRVVWALDYADNSARNPDDGCVPSELWTDPIEVRFGTTSPFATPVPTLGNGLLRVLVEHDAASRSKNGKTITVPPSMNIQSDDFNALTGFENKPGCWVYLFLYREAQPADGGIITSTNVSNVIVSADGIPLYNSIRLQDIATYFNFSRAMGGLNQSEGQIEPVPGVNTATAQTVFPGALLNDQPGTAAAAGQGVTTNFLPLIFPPRDYNVSMMPRAKTGVNWQLTGTLGSYKVGYRLIERRPDASVGNAARRLGVTNAKYGAKTGTNKGIGGDPELAPYLPSTVQET